MLPLKLTLIVTLFAATFAAGCKQEHTPVPQVAPLSVEHLLTDGPRYTHKIVTVHGCYVRGLEQVSAIEPCGSQKHDRIVLIESADDIVETAKHIKEQSVPEPVALRTPPKTNFLFRYDEAKSRIAWEKLRSALSRGTAVTVTGQFEGPSNIVNAGIFARGRLILIETLDVKPI